MKSVLLLSTPNNCSECQLMVDGWCYAVKENTLSIDLKKRPGWCPLRPLPQNYDNGMNIVIDIPKPHYERLAIIANKGHEPLGYLERVILHGTPLEELRKVQDIGEK